jgi:hypothetical protein
VLVDSWGVAYGDISGSPTTASPYHSFAVMELISGSPNILLLDFLIFFTWMSPKYSN